MTIRRLLSLLVFVGFILPAAAQERPAGEGERLARQLFESPEARAIALVGMRERGKTDVVPGLVQALRFARDSAPVISETLQALTGADPGSDWHQWMLWQQAHPEVTPFDGFDGFKADLMARIDPNFRLFLQRGMAHEIRLEEIVWGGVIKDGIPSLDDPALISADAAAYLNDDDLVFGVAINGDVRAYPLRILDWHEMFNDVVGGLPVTLAYCTLCGSGILFDARLPPSAERLTFGSSGFLYRSNKLMYDQGTHSLWNQFTGRPVAGPLVGSGIELKVLPVVITDWQAWRTKHPDTKVLSLDTGFRRDYSPGRPYGDYFASADLMFPALVADKSLAPKDYVFALRTAEAQKAWPLSAFAGGRVINDRVGNRDIVLVGDADTRTVRAYAAGGRRFAATGTDIGHLTADGKTWTVDENRLVADDGTALERLPGHIAYWFAFQGYFADAPLSGG